MTQKEMNRQTKVDTRDPKYPIRCASLHQIGRIRKSLQVCSNDESIRLRYVTCDVIDSSTSVSRYRFSGFLVPLPVADFVSGYDAILGISWRRFPTNNHALRYTREEHSQTVMTLSFFINCIISQSRKVCNPAQVYCGLGQSLSKLGGLPC